MQILTNLHRKDSCEERMNMFDRSMTRPKRGPRKDNWFTFRWRNRVNTFIFHCQVDRTLQLEWQIIVTIHVCHTCVSRTVRDRINLTNPNGLFHLCVFPARMFLIFSCHVCPSVCLCYLLFFSPDKTCLTAQVGTSCSWSNYTQGTRGAPCSSWLN